MTRSLHPLILLVFFWALVGCGEPSSLVEAPARDLSIVVVTLDTTRADGLEPYGNPEAETPALMRLAREGVLFEQAYAVTPLTLPSHATMFTGLNPTRHGVRHNGIHYLAESHTTLAEILVGQGFQTAAFVSAAVLDSLYGLDQGFQHYDDGMAESKRREIGRHPERIAEDTVESAIAWLDRRAPGKRFLLWVHLFDPHAIFAPPEPFATRFRDRPYAGEIAYMDSALAPLLDHTSVRDQVVMVLGDHGESLGEHAEANHAMLAYDSTLHIPWLVRHPSAKGGRRLTLPAGQVDLLPTVLELLGIDRESIGSGISHARAILGAGSAPSADEGSEKRAGTRDRPLYAETFAPFHSYGWAKLRAVRLGRWKYIDAPAPELYDLAEDGGELENLVASRPREVRRLRAALAEFEAREVEPGAVLPPDDSRREALRGLGYLGSRPAGSETPDGKRPDPKAMIDLHRQMADAREALYRGETELAAERLRSVLDRDPGNVAALTELAKADQAAGRFADAESSLRRALALAPESAELRVVLATLLRPRGDLETALQELDRALAAEPRYVGALVDKARLLGRLERGGESAAVLETGLALDGDHARLNVAYAELVELPRGQATAAETRLRAVTRRDPLLEEGWLALGKTLEVGDPMAAESVYRQGLAELPRSGALHATLGILAARRGDIAAAETHLAEARDLMRPVPGAVHDGLAALAARRGDWPEVERAARRAVAADPDLVSAWNHLAAALEERGDRAEALSTYERLLEVDPGYLPGRFNYGLVLRRLGRYRDAVAAFDAVVAQKPKHAKAHYELGLVHGGPLGNAAAARRHLTLSLEAEPAHRRVPEIRRLLASLPPAG